ncbi:unnamed protein product, partial [Staurois parvus]
EQRSKGWCAVSLGHSGSPINGKSQRHRLCHVISCVQSQLLAWDIYTDHQGTDDQCALMISVAPAVPPVSAHQYQLSMLINATCQCQSVPHQCHISCLPVHINATYQCPSQLPFSATYQCKLVSPISAHQCRLAVPVSAVYQCQSVSPISATYQ